MDSKGKKIGILIVLCTLLVVMAAVVVVNYKRFMGGDSKAANEKGAMSASGQMIEPDGRVHGVDLSAFLKDSSFFDAETPNNSSQTTYDEVDENGEPVRNLTLLASSAERDIRVKIIDEKGEPVSGQEFMVEVADTGVYADEDQDGVILISDIKPGDYKVSLGELPCPEALYTANRLRPHCQFHLVVYPLLQHRPQILNTQNN